MAKTNDGDEDDSTTDGGDNSVTDIGALRTAREMGRIVIDHQIENLNSINKKAANTIRLNILILGVVLTVFSMAISNTSTGKIPATSIMNGGTGAGVLLSGISILAALWTYTSTRKEVGPTGESILKSVTSETKYSERGWLKGTIRAQAGWIDKNDKINRKDSFLLFFSHLYLFLSVGFYSFGVIWGLAVSDKSMAMYSILVILLSLVLPSIVIIPYFISSDNIPDPIYKIFEGTFNAMMGED